MPKKRTIERQRQKPNRPYPDESVHSSGSSTESSGSEKSPEQSTDSGNGGQSKVVSGGSGRSGGHLKGFGRYKLLLAGLAAVVLSAGLYFGAGAGGDVVSEQETQSRLTDYQALIAGSPFPIKFVSAQDMDKAFDTMPDGVSDEQKRELRTQVDSGKVKLAWLSLWDTHAEDGDILRFESVSSFPIDVMALNQKTTIAIPFPADGQVMVTGVKDGGGGITIALESGAAEIFWPTMQPNDQLMLPVTPGF